MFHGRPESSWQLRAWGGVALSAAVGLIALGAAPVQAVEPSRAGQAGSITA